jgi:hypothetical protein
MVSKISNLCLPTLPKHTNLGSGNRLHLLNH